MAPLNRIVEASADYAVVLEPDRNEPEWWAGAPSVARGPDKQFYLAARMRHPEAPKGQRGYELRILHSGDGRVFEPIHRITRAAAAVPGFERPALVVDPATGRYKLYACAELDNGWTVMKFDDAVHPGAFDPRTLHPIIAADRANNDFIRVHGYKDPVVFHDEHHWHMFVIGIDRIERIHHFVSGDGETWQPGRPGPLLENTGWHNCYTRPASVLPLAAGYLFVYEGSSVQWHDANYNIASGLAYSPDLTVFHDLSPHQPLFTSSTPGAYHTWRYSHWMNAGQEVLVYFEAARPDGANEIRLFTFPSGGLNAAG